MASAVIDSLIALPIRAVKGAVVSTDVDFGIPDVPCVWWSDRMRDLR
jgi:hypothetical protein